jgi:16S rRNA (adenine1518-N6/adenine1519-N6)-dimethyltransferase
MERLYAKKSMGQNFLVDGNVLRQIAEAVDIGPDDRILEVGPGKGALTNFLAQKAGQVVAVELDRRLVAWLRERFQAAENVEVVEGDILRTDISRILSERWKGKWKVAANLPYNISSQVLFMFMDNRSLFSELVLMLQKEVGNRLVAQPCSKEYGILSVFCGLYFDITRELLVRPGSFRPIPKVDSLVLKFRVLDAPRVEVVDEMFFRKVVKSAFSQRRKTLWNCLRSVFPHIGDDMLKQVLQQCRIDPGRRGETLSLEEFAVLANTLSTCALPG